jgi:flagellar hook-associated protein 2
MSINSTSSSSGASSSYNFDGVMSGLSTTSIINAMMAQQQGPLNQLKAQQSAIQARDAAYQALETKVTSLQASLHTLMLPSNVNAKAVASATTTVATATANSGAANGTYALNVDHLATASTVSSAVGSGTNWTAATIGAGLNASAPIQSAGFAIQPTMGTFTINGKQISISNGQTLQNVVDVINGTQSINVHASINSDATGKANFISLQSTDGQAIKLGAGDDTSNFLTAAHLVATGISGLDTADITSSVPLGSANTSALLSDPSVFGTGLKGPGSFTVNGKTINWDASKDSISSILGKINTSGAGVTAVYDPMRDAVTMTNIATGNQSIALSDTSGGLLSALHLSSDPNQQSLGKTAQFQINGGAWQYSNSNTVSNTLPGVSIKLSGSGSTSLSVSQDSQSTITNVQSFVSAFNDLVDAIDQDTAYDAANKKASVLTGDSGMTSFGNQLRSMLTNSVSGLSGQYNTLASIGISTGSFGATVGSTNHLVLDQSKLSAALQSDPNSVVAVIAGTANATLNPGPTGASGSSTWITGISGAPLSSQHGQYRVTVDPSGNLSTVFTPDGGTALSPMLGSVSANSSNTTLIPGLTINVGTLPRSTVTDTISFHQSGILGTLNDFLTRQLGSGGVFDTEHTAANAQVGSLNSQITNANALLAQRQQTLQQQFTAMETALAQIQAQGGNMLAQMGVSNNSSSSSSKSSSSS